MLLSECTQDILPKDEFVSTVMILSFLDRWVLANSTDPDQTAPRGAV